MKNMINRKIFWQLFFIFLFTVFAYSNIFPNRFLGFEIFFPSLQKTSFSLDFGQMEFFLLGTRLAEAVSFLIGTAPFNFHLFSLILHLTNIFLVYKIVLKITSRELAAFLTAIFFSIHPAQTEAVTQMTNFPILIGSLGVLGSFYYYLKSMETAAGLWNRERVLSIVLILLASLFFKQALIFPVLIFCWEAVVKKNKQALNSVYPYAVVTSISILAAFFLTSSNANFGYLFGSLYLNFLCAVKALGRYILTALVPIAPVYDPVISEGIFGRYPDDFDKFFFLTQSIADISFLIPAFLISAVFIILKRWKKEDPVSAFGGCWFFICLIPVLSLWPTRIFYSESYLYLANVGFAVVLGSRMSAQLDQWSLQNIKTLFKSGIIASMIIFGIVQSWMRNLDWRNDKAFYAAAVEANPQSYLMSYHLAESYLNGLESEKGIEVLQQMLVKYPQKSELYVLLAQGYRNLNQYKKVIGALEKAIQVDPQNADAYYKLSEVYALWRIYRPAYQNLDKAVYYFRKQGRDEEADRIENILKQYADQPFNQKDVPTP